MTTKHISISKAVSYRHNDENDDICITVSNDIDVTSTTINESFAIYENDATVLCDALIASLPGMTFDRLLGKMLHHRGSMFCVRLGDRPK